MEWAGARLANEHLVPECAEDVVGFDAGDPTDPGGEGASVKPGRERRVAE